MDPYDRWRPIPIQPGFVQPGFIPPAGGQPAAPVAPPRQIPLPPGPTVPVGPAVTAAPPVAQPPAAEGDIYLQPTAPIPTARPEIADAPAVTPTSTEEDMLAEIRKRRELLDGLFPQRDTGTSPEQARADADAEKDRDRTKLMAPLAFASGLTAAGGGHWEEIGKGFASAGAVYDAGFQRYQQTLQSAADRALKKQDMIYKDDLNRTEAAIGLYQEEKTAGREAVEKRRKEYADFFKTSKPEVNDMNPGDPEEMNNWRRRYEYYIQTGEFPPEYNVSD